MTYCELSYGLTACRHPVSVSYAKQHEQLIAVNVTVNFLGEQTCEGSFEILREFFRHCPSVPCCRRTLPVPFKTHSSVNLCRLVQVKVKVKLSLCVTKHHAMKAYWGMEV